MKPSAMPGPIVFFDTEYTAWEGSQARAWSAPGEHREIVQIGAVKLDDGLNEIGCFEMLVRPAVNPILSEYFVALTGITQAQVYRLGVPFDDALARFLDFVQDARAVFSNGTDYLLMEENRRAHHISRALPLGRCANLRPWLARGLGLDEAAVDSGHIRSLIGEGERSTTHDALADARSVAAGYRYLVRGKLADPPVPSPVMSMRCRS